MKIRHPIAVKVAGFAAACLARVWLRLVNYRYRWLGPMLEPNRVASSERCLYAFWHENLITPAYHYGESRAHVLVSTHADGELVAVACRWLGFRLVRGSSARDAVKAVRAMIRRQDGHLAVTPDGPRGPRRVVQPGLIYLASRTGLPIVILGFAHSRAWRARSWDRMALPLPWSSVVCFQAEPIRVPEDAGKNQLEAYRLRVADAMRGADEAAERLLRCATRPEKGAEARRAA